MWNRTSHKTVLAGMLFKYSCEEEIVYVLFRGKTSLGSILTQIYSTETQLLLCHFIDLHFCNLQLLLAIIVSILQVLTENRTPTQTFGSYKLLHLQNYYIPSMELVTHHSEMTVYF